MNEPTKQFKWRQNGGVYIDPKDMHTRHLYFTLCMIWNHTMPYEHRTHDFQRYEFGPAYTVQYMMALANELNQRHDLKPEWRETLGRLQNYLESRQRVSVREIPR